MIGEANNRRGEAPTSKEGMLKTAVRLLAIRQLKP